MEIRSLFRVHSLNHIISAVTNSDCIKGPKGGGGKFIFLRKMCIINNKEFLRLPSLTDGLVIGELFIFIFIYLFFDRGAF